MICQRCRVADADGFVDNWGFSDGFCAACRNHIKYGGAGCLHEHFAVWTGGNTEEKIPDGTPCRCGAFRVKWISCSCCGQDKLTWVPV